MKNKGRSKSPGHGEVTAGLRPLFFGLCWAPPGHEPGETPPKVTLLAVTPATSPSLKAPRWPHSSGFGFSSGLEVGKRLPKTLLVCSQRAKRGCPAELCLLGSSGLGVPGWETPSQGLGAQEWGLCPTVSPPWSHAWVSIRVLGMVVPGGAGFGALVCVLHWRAPERGANPAGHPLRKRTRLKKGRQKDRRKSSAEPPRRAGEAQARPGEGEGAEICRAGCASLSAGSD